jgi:hypothetical protein
LAYLQGGMKIDAIPRPALYLGGGALVALVLHFLTCSVFDMGVHLVAHECLGHAAAGWIMGRFAITAIYFTTWGEPSRFIEVLIWAALAYGTYHFKKIEEQPRAIALGIATVIYPLLAFTKANELLCIAGGHLGEIFWAAFFFYRATRGGFFQDQERPLYASLGWFLWIGNVKLFFGLATSDARRVAYESVSLVEGVANDFVRVAQLCNSSLGRVGALMLLVSIVVPPAGALLGWKLGERVTEESC